MFSVPGIHYNITHYTIQLYLKYSTQYEVRQGAQIDQKLKSVLIIINAHDHILLVVIAWKNSQKKSVVFDLRQSFNQTTLTFKNFYQPVQQ